MRKSKLSKMLSFLLCFVMVATSIGQMTSAAFAVESADAQLCITEDGEEVSETFISKNGNTVLSVEGASGDVQWQYYAKDYDLWISIFGETEEECSLTYAKVCNMLDDEQQTKLRCIQKDGADVIESNEVVLSVIEMEEAASYPMMRAAAPASNNAVSKAAEEGEKTTFNVVINYVFTNGEIAADTYTASLAKGSNFSTTVTFPTVQGYLPYVGEAVEPSENIELNITNIQEDVTYTVTYKPTNVDYTVIHYQQNLDNDNYTEVARETKQGLTGSTVPEVAKSYDGFYALLYEKPTIAADESTFVEVYYDRYYYLMNFDMGEGAYGTEPIYARFGTEIGKVTEPTRAGYKFVGWSLDGSTVVSLPKTMPAGNVTYIAVWQEENTAPVTVVFWGENADDEEYSYIKSSTVNVAPGTEFTYSEDGTLICSLEEGHTHSDACEYLCGSEEHSHSVEAGCYELTCTETSHNHEADGCTLDCTHVHTVNCYKTGNNNYYDLVDTNKPTQTLTDKGNGIYTYTTSSWGGSNTHWYLNIGEKWYCAESGYLGGGDTTEISLNCTHSHSDDCYTCNKAEGNHTHSISAGCYKLICIDTVHVHSDACGYDCGKVEHSHTSDCYMNGAGLDSDLWTLVKSDTVTVAADGSTVMNVYYDRTEFTLTFRYGSQQLGTITEKWGANIVTEFTAMCDLAREKTSRYSGWEDSTTGNYVDYIGIMPQMNKTLTVNTTSSSSTSTMTYYIEDLNGEDQELFKIQFAGSYNVTTDEYYELEGFTIDKTRSTRTGSSCNGAKFYYTRNVYNLDFNDGYKIAKTEPVKYEAPLSTYENYEPEVPTAYEPGSVTFGGWYLNPECTGEEYDLSTHIMPSSNLVLYAKWIPVQHKVEFYLDKTALDAGAKIGSTHPDLIVDHGSKVEEEIATPINGDYVFVGWFYMDGEEEKAFDFENMPIRKDMKVYAKWSSNTLKEYTVKYMIQGTETEIAPMTEGSGLAGATKTFDAKGGTELYADYQEGYFPVAKSHSMTLDIENDANNHFTFWYVQKEAVPYTVKYLNAETGEPVADEKVVSDNRKAVVTETFAPVGGYLPDAYQKRLVVDGSDEAVNEIIFYYTKDDKHAYYKITHYTENLAKDADGNTTWTEYASSQAIGDIGETYTADELTINGFTYNPDIEGTLVKDKLTANGLELKLYYTRNEYPYQVRYLEEGTGKQLEEPKNGTGKYGEVVSESAIDIENYTAVDPTSQTLNIRIETDDAAKLNIITFYYEENEVQINYQVVGPTGCGTVTPTSEILKVVSGEAQGSTANVSGDNYRFIGWYKDAACTELLTNDVKYVPAKVDGKNVAATYYAKFEYALTSMTISKSGISSADAGQTIKFNIIGTDDNTKDINIDVVVVDNNSVTIDNLPVGNYTVTEDMSWTSRYTNNESSKTINLEYSEAGTTVTFKNVRSEDNWLDYNTSVDNKFSSITKVND